MARVFIGNLAEDCRERDIEKLFRDYGRVTDICLKGVFGFLNFEDKRDASDAIRDMNGERFNGRRIQVEYAKGGGRDRGFGGGRDRYGGGGRDGGRGRGGGKRSGYRLLVENLSSRTSWQDLKDYMRKAGDVVYTDIERYSREGVVEFADREAMEYALRKLDDTELDGRWIRLRKEGGRGGGRDRSRSRGRRDRSRSRSRERSRGKNRSRSRSESRSRSRSVERKRGRYSRSSSRSGGRRSRSESESRSPSAERSR